jgi:hypothetical protein
MQESREDDQGQADGGLASRWVQPGMGELTQRPAIGTGRWSFARPGGWSAPKERRETNGVK